MSLSFSFAVSLPFILSAQRMITATKRERESEIGITTHDGVAPSTVQPVQPHGCIHRGGIEMLRLDAAELS